MLAILAQAVVPALLPALADGVRSIFNRVTGGAGAMPTTVAEVVQLMQADVARLQALSTLDSAQGASAWVVNIRSLQRPVAVAVILSAYAGVVLSGQDATIVDGVAVYAQMVTFYLFGDRSYSYLRKR